MKTNRLYNVFVQGAFANQQSGRMMMAHPSRRFTVVKNILYADIVVFTGGADINPAIYGSRPLPSTYFSPDRDKDDLEAVRRSEGKALVGLCRGAQLLNCNPNGGTLWQDVTGHGGSHHEVTDYVNGGKWVTNSLHHQMMRPGPDAEIVAGCEVATRKETYESVWRRDQPSATEGGVGAAMLLEGEPDNIDPEVVWYEKTRSLLVQFHPEFGHPSTTEYFYELVDRYLLPSMDRKWDALKRTVDRMDVV